MLHHTTIWKMLFFPVVLVLSFFAQQTFAQGEQSKREIEARKRAERRTLTAEEIRAAKQEQAGRYQHVYAHDARTSAVVYTRRPGSRIPELGIVRDTLATPALTNLNYVSVRLDTILHTFNGDMTFSLTSPNGLTSAFCVRRGGGNDNFIGTAFTNFAYRPISAAVTADTPYTGFWIPDSNLTRFQGASMPAGNWILTVQDFAAGDSGTIVQWSLVVEPNEIVPPNIVHTKVRDSTITTSRQAVAVISDTSGVATGANAPRLLWKLRSGATYTALATDSVNATTKTYYWTIPGQAAGAIVDYYIGAQDLAATNNSGTLPFGGSGSPPGATAPPKVFSYIVAQPLAAGSYTVGLTAGSTFPTLDSAFNRIRLNGIAGAVTFNLNDTLYSAPDRPIIGGGVPVPDIHFEGGVQAKARYDNPDTVGQITLQGPIYGAGPASRITIRPAANKKVVINGNGPSVLRLLDASWVTIDGITNTPTGVTTLTIGDPASGAVGILLEGNSDNNIITRVQLRLPQGSGSAAIFLTNSVANGTPDNNVIGGTSLATGNIIHSATDGILIIGNATAGPTGNIVRWNQIGSATDSLGEVGVYNQQAYNTQINNNIIQNIRTIPGFNNVAGIWISTKHLNTRVWNNVIKNVKVSTAATAAGFATGLYAFGTIGDVTSGDYYNNAIYDLDNISSFTTGTVRGIFVANGSQDTIAYNSIWLTGTAATAKQSAAIWASTHVAQVWRNNIAINNRVETGTGFGLAFYKASTTSTLTTNRNDLYVPTNANSFIGRVGAVNYATLNDWRTQTYDSNSVSHNQAFRAGTDLRIDTLQGTPVNNIGQPIARITADIDNQVRSLTTPDPGVDEFNAPAFNVHDIGVATLARTSANDGPVSSQPSPRETPVQVAQAIDRRVESSDTDTRSEEITDNAIDTDGVVNIPLNSAGGGIVVTSAMADTARFRAIVQNYGSFPETTYQVRWDADGVVQGTLNNTRILAVAGRDTFNFQWNTAAVGSHIVRAWTLLGTDLNRTNDTATTSFTITPAGGPVVVLPGNGSTSGNARAPQGSRLFANSKYLITGAEMTTSAFGANRVSSIGWRWNAPRPTGAGAPAAQSVATTGNLKVFLKDTTGGASGLIGTFIDTNGVGYTKVIDATLTITRTDTLEFTLDVPTGGPGTSPFTVTSGNGILVIFVYTTTTPIATPLGAPTVFCTNVGSILTYQSQTVNGTLGTASTFRPETRFGKVLAPPAVEHRRDHVTSAFRATVTNEGTVGYLNAFPPAGPGNGFMFNPVSAAGQHLFGDGIMIALDSTRVSDGARTTAGIYDADFKFLTTIDSSTSGNRTTMTTSYTDSLAETPFGARVNQRTVSWDSVGLNNFLIFELDLVNTTATAWTTLHAGAVLDWDVEPAGNDRGAVVVDSTNTIPGVNGGNPFAFDMLELHQGATPNSWMGVVPLNENRFRGRRIAISSTEIYNPAHLTNGDKWRYMISNRATNPNGDGGSTQDHAQVFGSGPYSVAAGATKRVGFAMFGGTSLANAVAAARAAQQAWVQRLGNTINVIVVGVDEKAGLPEVFDLAQNYPNPFNPSTTIRYALPEAANVNLSIYNLLGQRVATLTNEVQSAGYYNAVWNGRNQAGSQVATGVYFYRIEAIPVSGGAPFISLKKALLLK